MLEKFKDSVLLTTIENINQILDTTGITDFRIQSYNSCDMSIIGSYDLSYYYDLEIIFSEVTYISIPTTFDYPKLRIATKNEISVINQFIAHEEEYYYFCIETETCASLKKLPFFIVAESISFKEKRVSLIN